VSKQSVFKRIEKEWQGFLESGRGLSDEVLLEPNAVGVWSIRDILAHISTWEEETMKNIPLILNGQPTPRYASLGGIDTFNAREQDRKRNLSLDEVEKQLLDFHEKLLDFLSGIPESDFKTNKRLLNRIRWDTYHHYHEHAQQIQEWREQRGI
jgi:hypothetical protein